MCYCTDAIKNRNLINFNYGPIMEPKSIVQKIAAALEWLQEQFAKVAKWLKAHLPSEATLKNLNPKIIPIPNVNMYPFGNFSTRHVLYIIMDGIPNSCGYVDRYELR